MEFDNSSFVEFDTSTKYQLKLSNMDRDYNPHSYRLEDASQIIHTMNFRQKVCQAQENMLLTGRLN
jgi:hypothetical protein